MIFVLELDVMEDTGRGTETRHGSCEVRHAPTELEARRFVLESLYQSGLRAANVRLMGKSVG